MKLTEIFGKQVYSLYEGALIGTINGATFNQSLTKIKSFILFDQDENEHELYFSNIKALSDHVIISNKTKLNYFLSATSQSPMQKEIVDNSAKCRGKLIDAEINQNGSVECFITNNNEKLKPSYLYHRKDFIFCSEKKVCMSKFKPQKYDILETKIKVRILENSIDTNFLPTKIKFNPNSIIGKVAKSDLLGKNNEVIIKSNQQITEKIIDLASQHNRLNQLFYIAF